MKKKVIFIIVLGVVVVAGGYTVNSYLNDDTDIVAESNSLKGYEGKKVLYIDSYHEGYAWSDGITAGIKNILGDTNVELKIHRMDTKRNTDETFKKTAALKAKSVIEDYTPDVVIVSDDNAFKYLIQPYYRDAELPVVFSGLNWDAAVYEAPYTNTTGMVEVSLTVQLIDLLREYANGNRVGYLTADVLTERKNAEYYSKLFDLNFEKSYFVTSMDEWKDAFLKLQREVDIIIFENNAGIVDWDDDMTETFVLDTIKIPVGTTNPWIMQSSLLGLTKIPEEQGEWSAKATLDILNGASPSEIPVVNNKKGKLIVNLRIAEKLDLVLKSDVLRNAEIFE